MRFVALAYLFFLCLPAHAGSVILMLNMNYSSSELQAAEEQAAARGQRVEMIPPKSMVALVEPMFVQRDKLEEEIGKQFPDRNPTAIRSALAGIMRKGSAWDGDAAIAAFVGRDRMNQMNDMANRVAAAEKQNGEMYDQLRRKAQELRAKGDKVDSVILSSHSDGSNLTGETANRLSANDLYRLKQEEPGLFDNARHVLLLGCYGMTKPNHRAWRYDVFPHASLLAGFGIKAPSRFDNTSPNFIRQTMAKANELDLQMARAGQPLDPATLEAAFKSLSSFTTKSHPGVIDYCSTVIEGQPGTWARDCDTQWKNIYEKKEKMRDYWSLRDPREDPPSVGGGELRVFYNMLQGACPASEAKSEADDPRGSERFRVSMRENVIRLIFWWNVQNNFATYYENDIRAMNARLSAAGIWETMPKLDGTTSRVSFVRAYGAIDAKLRQKDPALAREFQRLYSPLFYLKGEDTVAAGEKMTTEETLARGAIPFNWIEGTTVMRRRT